MKEGESGLGRELDRIFSICSDLVEERNKKYGDSWTVLSIQSIANLIEMKMHRIAKLGYDAKTIDEFKDALVYAAFGLLKMEMEP